MKLGFSLIELMVVIAIVALLAAVAVPSYKTYVIKSKIANVFPLAMTVVEQAKLGYETKGAWPSSYTLKGVTIPLVVNNADSVVQLGDIYSAQVYWHANAPNALFLNFGISGLTGIPNYVEPSVTLPQRNYLTIALRAETNGTYIIKCGDYDPSNSAAIPIAYLPSICSCTSVWSWWINQTAC